MQTRTRTPQPALDKLLAELSTDWTEEDWERYHQKDLAFQALAARLRQGRILKNRLKELGLTQRALAARIGMQPSEVNRILNGQSNYSSDSHHRVIAALGLEVEYVKIEEPAA